jgi:hypothetical protein
MTSQARGPLSMASHPLAMGWAHGPLAGLAGCDHGTRRPRRAWSQRLRPARWHGRRQLTVARGGARSVAQALGSLGACTRQGVGQGSSPEWHVGGERAELEQ